MSASPKCGEPLQPAAKVCRHCLHVLDREAWQEHDAGRLGADDRGGGRPIEDPPIGPIPLTGGGVAGAGLVVAEPETVAVWRSVTGMRDWTS
jgi:hypothetical protein